MFSGLAALAAAACSTSSPPSGPVDSGGADLDAGPSCIAAGGLCLILAAPRYGGHCPAGTAHVASGDCSATAEHDCCAKAAGATVPICAAAGGQCMEVPLGTCGGGSTHVDSSDCFDSATHDCCVTADAGADASSSDAASDGPSDAAIDAAIDASTD